MIAQQKCIAKWEKKLAKAEKMDAKYGQYYGMTYKVEIKIYQEVIKDLKRVTT